MRRRIVLFVALALGVVALGLAALPFTARSSWNGPVWSDVPELGKRQLVALRASCEPAAVSAWRKPANDEQLWAVTVGSNMEGEASGYVTGVCRDDARRRLSWAGGLGALATGTAIVGRRSHSGWGKPINSVAEGESD